MVRLLPFAFYILGLGCWLVAVLIGRPVIVALTAATVEAPDGMAILAISASSIPNMLIASSGAICGTLALGFGAVIATLEEKL